MSVQTLVRSGYTIQNSDSASGVASLAWTRGEMHGNSRAINPLVADNTTAKVSSFQNQWIGYRIVGATLTAAPDGEGCRVSIEMAIHGAPVNAHNAVVNSNSQKEWLVLGSNGHLEYLALMWIEGALGLGVQPGK